ncbi:hypothetical protein Thiowin_02045 [Thiorhodovibrio winogradskyi]|uniref:HMA domain-containing protein n=1 Tax=Thiorhodovibrio winogradskyi TaxID=77007 RepID=A0ABZ0S979_9GAMM|nr:hypothetical protein [Thiorhodovibrio winogradskyi]
MFEVRHQLPGRLRLHCPALRTKAWLAAALRGHLQACDGVRSVRINPACASVVIAHDARHFSADQLQQRLRALLSATPVQARTTTVVSVAGPLLAVSGRGSRDDVGSNNSLLNGSRRDLQGSWLRLPKTLSEIWGEGGRSRMLGWLWRKADNSAPKGGAVTILESPSPAVAMLCRINWRISHWMLRQTLRCWWNGELGSDQGRAMVSPRLTPLPRSR